MYNGKRLLSLLLALTLLLSCVPIPTLGTETQETTVTTETTESVEMIAPTETSIPVETTAPAETTVPVETTAPAETTTPEETIAPAEVTAPEETIAPAETTVPEETIIPTETTAPTEATPVETTKSVVTATKEITVANAVKETAANIAVDFMDYLENPLAVVFQSAEDINLHDYLVNAYGVPAEIPFTCEPATVACGEYEDGDSFDLTVTAGEGYAGSCTLEAEVHYLNSEVISNVLTVTYRIYQGNQLVKQVTEKANNSFNDVGYDYLITSWNVTLQADTEYKLEVSWGPPLADGYGRNQAQVVEMYSARQFQDPANTDYKTLSVTDHTGMNTLSQTGSASCKIKSDGYGAYTMHIALDDGQNDNGYNRFKIKLTFQASGKEDNASSTVPQGSNIPLMAKTNYSEFYYNYSWTKNGEPISGANGKTYTVPTASPGDIYVATISRRPNDVGCTGSESWTHTFTVSEETISGPTAIDGLVYDGTVQKLFNDGTAPTGYDVYYYMPYDNLFLLGYNYEDFWNEGMCPFVPEEYSGNAGTYKIRWFIGDKGTNITGAIHILKRGEMSCTIAKASPTLEAAPTPVTGLKFNGQPHNLVSAGAATNGTLQYRLPGGSWSGNIPTATNAGTYTVEYRIVGKDGNYRTLEDASYKVTTTIAPAALDDFIIACNEEKFTYDGTPKEPTVVVIFQSQTLSSDQYTVEYKDNTDAGKAKLRVTSPNWEGKVEHEFTIYPIELTNLRIENRDKTYDGSVKAENAYVAFDGLIEQDQDKVEIAADIAYDHPIASKDIRIKASNLTLTGEKANNYRIPDGIAVLEDKGNIFALPVTVSADSKSKTYGEADPELTWSVSPAVPEGEPLKGIVLSRQEGEYAWDYDIVVTLPDPDDNPNYKITAEAGRFTINPKPLTVNVTVEKQFDNTTAVDKSKDTFRYSLEGLVNGDPVELNADGVSAAFAQAQVGTDIPVTLTGAFALTGEPSMLNNYTLTQPTGVTGTIYNNYDASGDFTVSPAEWTNGDVTIIAGGDCVLAEDINGSWSSTLTYTQEAASEQGNKAAFYVQNADGDISKLMEPAYFIDRTLPTGTIALKDREPWQELLSSITFGLFYNYEQTVTVTAFDTLSDVEKIEYLESAAALDPAALDTADWTEYTGPVAVTLSPAKQFIYYAKITDKAGNVAYLSTDGAVYDTIDPAITGVTGGETYYITKSVTVSDTNHQSVTLTTGTGAPVEQPEEFDLPGNVDAEYTIVAIDKAGNRTTVSVTMKPIETLDDGLDAGESPMTVDNVKLTDKKAITAIRDQAEDLMEQTEIPEEDAALQQILDRMEELLAAIAAAEAVIDQIEALPAADKAQPDSKTHQEALLKAQTDYKALTDNGRTMVGADNKAKLDAVAAALRTYKIIDGDGGKYTKGSGKTLSFTANGPVKLELSNGKTISFKGILVDGDAVDAKNYKVASGSTVVTLKNSYLESLKGGKHTIVFLYDHMGTEYRTNKASFRISIPSDNPKTGDFIDNLPWGGIALTTMLCMAMAVMLMPRKKGKYQR